MRVQNGAVDSSSASNRSELVQNQSARSGASSTAGAGADLVQLSNASSLVALAKGMMPADKQAKFEAVGAQFRSGAYQADAPGMSQAIVQGHVQG